MKRVGRGYFKEFDNAYFNQKMIIKNVKLNHKLNNNPACSSQKVGTSPNRPEACSEPRTLDTPKVRKGYPNPTILKIQVINKESRGLIYRYSGGKIRRKCLGVLSLLSQHRGGIAAMKRVKRFLTTSPILMYASSNSNSICKYRFTTHIDFQVFHFLFLFNTYLLQYSSDLL